MRKRALLGGRPGAKRPDFTENERLEYVYRLEEGARERKGKRWREFSEETGRTGEERLVSERGGESHRPRPDKKASVDGGACGDCKASVKAIKPGNQVSMEVECAII